MKNNELTNFEIENILKKRNIKSFNGIFMRDELDKIEFKKKGFYVINLDKSTGPGSHWCVIYKGIKTFYFDSFGFPTAEEIEKVIKPYIYSTTQIQDINSSSCGYYVILFIMYFNSYHNKDELEIYDNFIKLFNDDYINNEYLLYKYLKNYNISI
jgi:hypothetical protein